MYLVTSDKTRFFCKELISAIGLRSDVCLHLQRVWIINFGKCEVCHESQ